MKSHQNASKQRPPRGHALLFVALSLVLAYYLVSPFNIADSINPWLDGDYGMLTYNGLRILKGDLLYRDIWTVYAPAADHSIALLFLLFGDGLHALRFGLSLTGMATGLLVFYLVNSLTSVPWALTATALVFFMGPVCVNFPYPNWFCIPLGLGMVLLKHKGWKEENQVYHLLSGVIAGLMFCFKPNWGAFAFVGLLYIESLGALLSEKSECRLAAKGQTAVFLHAALLVSLPIVSMFLIRDHFTAWNVIFFTVPASAVAAVGIAMIRQFSKEGRTIAFSFTPMVTSMIGFLLIPLPAFGYFLYKLGLTGFGHLIVHPAMIFAQSAYFPPSAPNPEALLFAFLYLFPCFLLLKRKKLPLLQTAFFLTLWASGILFGYKLISVVREGALATPNGYGSWNKWAFTIVTLVPFAVHVGLAPLLLNDIRNFRSVGRSKVHLLLSIWIYSVATLHVFYPVAEIFHLIWIMPPVTVLGASLIFRLLHYWNSDPSISLLPRWLRLARVCSVILLPAMLGVFFCLPVFNYFFSVSMSPFEVGVRQFSDIRANRAGILMPSHRADAISEVIDFVEANTNPEDVIFDMTGSFFYFLTDRRSPTRWGHFSFPGFFSPQDLEEIKLNLERTKPRIIVDSYEADKAFCSKYPDLYRYIYTRYRTVKYSGEYSVLTSIR